MSAHSYPHTIENGAGERITFTAGAALRELWSSRQAAPALIGAPRVRILESVEDREY